MADPSPPDSKAAVTLVAPNNPAAQAELASMPGIAALTTGGFVLGGVVGTGGSGSVNRAFQPNLRRHIAMKVLAPRLASQTRQIERFVLEAQITAQLDHPNVVPIHDMALNPGGQPYFTMKLVSGRTLYDIVRDAKDKLADADTLRDRLGVFLKVCDAVAFAHSRGVIHCDIKPENIMVGAFGEVYLMDWGVASIRDVTGEAGLSGEREAKPKGRPGVRGTPSYMAPEQAANRVEDLAECTDVFGLGAVLYYILTARPPFVGSTVTETINRARDCSFVAPEVLATGAPIGLVTITKRAMSARPADRHASVLDLRKEVDDILRGAWHLPTQVFAPGACIVEEGAPGHAAYVVLSGSCVVIKKAGGTRKVIRRMGPGDVFGELSVLSRKPRTATVEAVDQVTVKVVTREILEAQLGIDTGLGKFVLVLADRFRELDEKLDRQERRRRKAAPAALGRKRG